MSMNNASLGTDDDDWETSDIDPKKSLRPTASAFNPIARPSPPTWLPSQGAAGPSYLSAQQRVADGEEDDWFRGDRRPQNNRQIWDSANTKPKAPSILAPQILPQPKVQLLRRTPSNSSPNSSGASSPTGEANKVKSYEERQEEYRLARERIFGAEDAVEGSSKPTPPASSLSQKQKGQGTQPRRQESPSQSYQPSPPSFAGLVPTQVRSSPSPSLSPNASPYTFSRPPSKTHTNPSVAAGVVPGQGGGGGLLRQPIGPGQGAGFGGAGGFAGYGRGA
ncbi:hypothetical protein IAR50_007297 [Cryptococcus sp. DSM 104548]